MAGPISLKERDRTLNRADLYEIFALILQQTLRMDLMYKNTQ